MKPTGEKPRKAPTAVELFEGLSPDEQGEALAAVAPWLDLAWAGVDRGAALPPADYGRCARKVAGRFLVGAWRDATRRRGGGVPMAGVMADAAGPAMERIQDLALVAGVCAGNVPAVRLFLKTYEKAIERMAFAAGHDLARSDAPDIAYWLCSPPVDGGRGVWTASRKRLESFDGTNLRGFLGTLVRRAWLDVCKARRRREGRLPGPGDAARAGGGEADADEDDLADLAARLRSALDGLPDAARRKLRMAVVEGRSQDEIGAAFGVRKSAVSKALKKAQRALGEHVRNAPGGSDARDLALGLAHGGAAYRRLTLALVEALRGDGRVA